MAKGNESPTRMKDDGMGGQVDILNTSYAELPEKWQAENKAQAQSAIGLVAQNMEDAMSNIEDLAAQVHEQWLSRNSWAKDGPLGVPYNELPEEEKQKDKDVISAAYDILQEMMGGQEDEMPEDLEEEPTDI
jgi:ABC-type dipeptide/oligopeptide/nickel transport system ATPase component